ncbi:MAG: ATP-binding protein [Candidatus Solibacter sp.]
MSAPILSLTIRYEHDAVAARQRARQIARLLGFDIQDQTRISTAVSEIARNAFNYAGSGRVEYFLEGRTSPQLFIVRVTDSGPGITKLEDILNGAYRSETGMGLGIVGARRLMDHFEIDTVPGRGTTVLLKKLLPRRSAVVGPAEIAKISSALVQEQPQGPFQELQLQNQELLRALEEIRARQTELTRLNRELEDTNRGVVALYAELDEKADHLRRADELKSRFLSNMSHEFRSPLNSVLALTGLLLERVDGDLSSEQAQQVTYIRKAAQDLLELVNDLLDLAKVEAGKVEAKPLEFEVTNLFAALRGMLRPLLLNQSVNLVFEEATSVPPLFTDEGKVSQILRNFISNALKFTERGEIRVSASTTREGEVRFSVQDTGIGIAAEHLELIFQEFGQVDHPIQRRVRGTGLGLPLSGKLATLLGGRVTVESELGAGSTFTLQIPARYREEAPKSTLVQAATADSGIPVMVVEDSPEMMMMYRTYLKGAGFRIIPASTTREAESILEQVLPAAIILDVILRSEDAWAFAARLKQNERTRGISVLVASSVEDENKGFQLGVDRYLHKPIESASLIRELRSLTGQPRLFEVLIIDDEERDRYLLKQRLRNLPILIEEAASGTDGIRRAALHRPDLIFLDLVMPDLTGFEVLRKLKSGGQSAGIPVVVVTSRVLTSTEREELLSRARDVVSKEKVGLTDFAAVMRRAAGENAPGLNGA